MAIIFDGRAFAAKKEEKLRSLGKNPRLASIIVGANPASVLYVGMKKKAAERVGAELDIIKIPENTHLNKIIEVIEWLNTDKEVNGIMVQLPLPGNLKEETKKILETIDSKKDVDGLRENSLFVHPTAMAVLQIIKEAERELKHDLKTIYILGESGMVGSSLLKEVAKSKLERVKESQEADIVVGATGFPSVIKSDMVKKDAVVIDVGSPRGDVDFKSVSKKASFMTPVPGGVGPVTISCLLENLISSVV